MRKAEAVQHHLSTAAEREALFAFATASETGSKALVPVDFLPTIYLALQGWIPYTTAGMPASMATPRVAKYIYEAMGNNAQIAMDCLLEIEDEFRREWEAATE